MWAYIIHTLGRGKCHQRVNTLNHEIQRTNVLVMAKRPQTGGKSMMKWLPCQPQQFCRLTAADLSYHARKKNVASHTPQEQSADIQGTKVAPFLG